MLPVSLDCPFLLSLRYYPTFICPVSCVPYVASFSGLSFFIAPSVFSNIYLFCVLCTLCCQFLWIVLFHCPFGILLHLFVLELVYPMLPVSLDWPFLLPFWYSLTFICPMSCVPYDASFSGLSFFIVSSVFFHIYFVLCLVYPMLPVSLDCPFHCPFGILLHLFVLELVYPMLPVSLDCPFLLPFRYSLALICSVSCVPYVASFSRLSFSIVPSVLSNI